MGVNTEPDAAIISSGVSSKAPRNRRLWWLLMLALVVVVVVVGAVLGGVFGAAKSSSGSPEEVGANGTEREMEDVDDVDAKEGMEDVPLGPPDTWENLPNVPIEMGEVSSGILTLAGKSYLLLIGEHPSEVLGSEENGATMIFDIVEETWSRGAKRTGPWHHQAAEVFDNKFYVFGGLGSNNEGGRNTLQIAELLLDEEGNVGVTWREGAQLPFSSGSASSGILGNTVAYCGGINEENTDTIATCASYSPATDTWDATTPPPMTLGRNHAATCSDGERLYVFGGREGKNEVGPGFGDTQIYSPGQGWSAGTPLPVARGGMGKAVFHEGKCYVFGGEVSDSEGVDDDLKVDAAHTVYSVDVYDVDSDTWTQAADLPKGVHGMFPVAYEGGVYIAAGGVEAGYSQSTQTWRYVL